MPEPTLETLAVWLQDVVATVPDTDTLKAFHAAVVHGSKCRESELLDVVALGHSAANKEAVEWFADLARSKGAPIPTVGTEALVERLAAASVVRLTTSSGDSAIAAGLATQSARFLGYEPNLSEVSAFADNMIVEAGDSARTRALSYEPTAPKVPGWVNEATKPAGEGEPPKERPDWESPAVEAAKRLDTLANEIQTWLELLDEEYNLLWWSHAGRSITVDASWADVTPPARRVALVGDELARQSRIPATAMVDGLAAVALGEVAAKQMSMADVIVAARDQGLALSKLEHGLLPISTALTQASVYTDDDTWKTVVEKTHGIDVGNTQSGASIARQLVREQHLGRLL